MTEGSEFAPARSVGRREAPLRTHVPSGGPGMKMLFQNHSFTTARCPDFVDVTGDVQQVVEDSGVENGMALVYSPHTTCAVVINERESGFIRDFTRLMDSLVPLDGEYHHDDMEARTE